MVDISNVIKMALGNVNVDCCVLQTMTCPTVATVLTSSMDQDNLVAAARSAATAVTSGIRNSLSTLSSGVPCASFVLSEFRLSLCL